MTDLVADDRRWRRAFAALTVGAVLALTGFGGPAVLAQDAPAEPAVVAMVGGEPITEVDLIYAAEDLAEDLQAIAPSERRAFLVSVLIDMKVMATGARALDMDQTDAYRQRLGYLEERALRRAYVTEVVSKQVTPDAVLSAYDEYLASFVPQEERRARHILVASEAEAQALAAQLAAGGEFDALAQQKSLDPSVVENGGDLGFFGRGRMVPQFEAAAFALDIGQVSEPVQTEYGWHIIRMDETRMSTPAAMGQVTSQLQQKVLFEAFDAAIATLKDGVEIEITDPVLAAAVAKEQAPAE